MLTRTIKGVVRNGKIEPTEELHAPDGTEVTVQLPAPSAGGRGKMITFGMFSGPPERMSTEEDFRDARRSIWGANDAG